MNAEALPAALPTAFVHEARLRMFQPTRRPASAEQIVRVATAHGKLEIEYRARQRVDGTFEVRALGQGHADLLDACRLTALHHRADGAGRVVLLVDPAKVKKAGGFSCSTSALREMLDDLAGALVRVSEPAHLTVTGHLIDTWAEARNSDGGRIALPCPLSRTSRPDRAERHLWAITIGDVGMRLLRGDLTVNYDLARITTLQSGIAQAAARWLLGQSVSRQPNGGWMLDTVIQAVAGELNATGMRHRRREMRADAPALAKLGILISADRVRRASVQQMPEGVQQMPEKTGERAANA